MGAAAYSGECHMALSAPAEMGCEQSTSPAVMILWSFCKGCRQMPQDSCYLAQSTATHSTQWGSAGLLTGAWVSGYLQEDKHLTIGYTTGNTLVILGYLFLGSYVGASLALVPGSRRPVLFLCAYRQRGLFMQLAICAQMKTLHQSWPVLPGLCHKIFGTIVVWLCREKCMTLAEVLSITNACMESLSLKMELKSLGSLYKVYIHSPLN